MFLLHPPDAPAIERFLAEAAALPLSYAPPGLADPRQTPHRGQLDDVRAIVTHGPAGFARARAALAAWRHFDFPWIAIHPARAPLTPGQNLAIAIRHLGFWSLNGGRIVWAVDEPHRLAYAYGTLPSHAEAGEEMFEVTFDPATQAVTYRIRAVSWPRAPLARLGFPIVRALQARFRRDSIAALSRALSSPPPTA